MSGNKPGCVICSSKDKVHYYSFTCKTGGIKLALCEKHKSIKEYQVENGHLLKRKKRTDGFKIGSGCFKCNDCGKLTRKTMDNVTDNTCLICEEIQMHENSHADNDFPNDDCGDPDCPVKDYPKEKIWWR